MKKLILTILTTLIVTMPIWAESTETVKEQNIPKEPRIIKVDKEVRILDKKDKVIKGISLKENTYFAERTLKDNNKYKFKKFVYKGAVVNKNNKYVGLITNEAESVVLGKGEYQPAGYESNTIGEVTLMDSNGKNLWTKKYTEGRHIPTGQGVQISDNGECTAVYTDDGEEGPHRPVVYIYDRNGNEVFKVGENDNYEWPGLKNISTNGRYVAIGVTDKLKKYPNNSSTIFYDLKNKTNWDSGKSYALKISDDGIVNASYPNPEIKDTDSYEKRVKEGRVHEVIDLKKYLGK